MKKQTGKIEELEEPDELRDSYTVEDKLFNISSSQISEPSCKPDRRRL